MSNQEDNEQHYPIEKKKRLAKEISNMRNKTHLKKIKEIIFEENPEIAVNKDNRGMLMFFQNLSYRTYIRLDKFLKKIEKEKLERQTLSITENSEQLLMSSDADVNADTVDYSKTRTRLRYSNKEKNLIKRQQYEKNINEKLDNSLSSDKDKQSTPTPNSNSNSDSESDDHIKLKSDTKSNTKSNAKSNTKSQNNKTVKEANNIKPKNTIFSKNTNIII
jgi:hypothetical protein